MRAAHDFPLCGDRATILQFEGTVQLILFRDGWPDGPRKVGCNLFCDASTADQLEAMAAHIRALIPAQVEAA